MVEEQDLYSPPDAEVIDEDEQRRIAEGHEPISEDEAAELKEKFKTENRKSLGLGIFGLVLQMAGGIFALFGTVMLIAALVFYAKMRGRSPWWGAFGLLSILGFAVLYFLGKVCSRCEAKNGHRDDTCEQCGAPLPP